MVVRFGQAVIGPPGAGKTTYCHGMSQFLQAGGRPVAIVNFDPANDCIPFKPDIDIAELVNLADVMEKYCLGPNGGLVYCMEYIEKNLDWVFERIEALQGKRYILFDFPGQVELYTHGDTVQRILKRLEKWGCRLTTVHLIDAHHCSDAGKFISAALISLTTMVRLELPHVNVLSKVDLIESHGRLAFNLDFYTDMFDLRNLLPYLENRPADPHLHDEEDEEEEEEDDVMEQDQDEDDQQHNRRQAGRTGGSASSSAFGRKYRRLNEALCELIEDFSLVSFQTLNIQDPESIARVLAVVDKCNGYLLGVEERAGYTTTSASAAGRRGEDSLLQSLEKLAFHAMPDVDRVKDVQDRYMGDGESSSEARGAGDNSNRMMATIPE